MEKRETGVGAYYFCDIAMSYFPLLSKKKASDKLSRWIRVSGKLMERLGGGGRHPPPRDRPLPGGVRMASPPTDLIAPPAGVHRFSSRGALSQISSGDSLSPPPGAGASGTIFSNLTRLVTLFSVTLGRKTIRGRLIREALKSDSSLVPLLPITAW